MTTGPHSMPVCAPRPIPDEPGVLVRRSTLPGDWWLVVVWAGARASFRVLAGAQPPTFDDAFADIKARPSEWMPYIPA